MPTMAEIEWWEAVLRLGAGALLGALVGLERESAGQDAGFRTHLLLALGAALFGVMSVGAFDEFIVDSRSDADASTNVQVDVTRIASYVAAGIGFLGGGAILKHGGAVRGITTAASIWAAAAIGLAAGLGFWPGAVTGTAVALVALAVLKPLSDRINRRSNAPKSLVVTVNDGERAVEALRLVHHLVAEQAPKGESSPIRMVRVVPDDDVTEVEIQFWSRPTDDLVELVAERLRAAFGPDAGLRLNA
jgi:putative Mg2+ transporter-C (MgtC) family protein